MKERTGKIKLGFIWALLALAVSSFWSGKTCITAAEENGNATNVELTVYNQNLALVKEQRVLNFPSGTGNISFTNVPALVDPSSVKLRVANDPALRLLEQNYEYDVINDQKLMQKYLGAKIKVTDTKGAITEGYLLGATDNLIIASRPDGGEVKVLKAAQIQALVFPELPNGLVIRPTLVWLVQNPGNEREAQAEVSYLTGGLSWKADYVATVNESDDRVDLSGWVTLENQSGADYQNAHLKLVAGDIHRAPQQDTLRLAGVLNKAAEQNEEQSFDEQSFFEYHLYTLSRPTTIKNYQMKQVELMAATAIPAEKLYIYEGANNSNKVKVMLEMKNSKEQNLGMALPQGRIRVEKADHDGALQLIGEDRIDHTPQDEKLRIDLGNAFDIVGERTRTAVKELSERTKEESYRIRLRNHKKEKVTVIVRENLSFWREWDIVQNDRPYTKTEAGKAEFKVDVPAGGETVINYTVRYKI